MKKIVLFILSVMAFAGMSVAQDVYTSGYYYNQEDDQEVSAVFKNGELLYYNHNASSGYKYASHAVLYLDGDVYWADNCGEENGGYVYGDVFKNDERWLSNAVTSHSVVSTLFADYEDNVYAAGTCDVNGSNLPVVWKNDASTPYAILDYVQGIIYDAEMFEGYVVACGLRETEAGYEGVIWRDGPQMTVINLGDLIPYSLSVYEGDIYTVVQDRMVDHPVVYRNDTELFTMSTGYYSQSICVDAGDVYAIEINYGIGEHNYNVWKNGQVILQSDGCPHALEVNSEGIFCVGEKGVAKDGELLFSTNDNGFYDISVDLDCQNNAIRTLPYYESFETGATDWTCWHVRDFDNQNDDNASYWHRGGENFEVNPPDGHHCAWHRYNSEFHQNGTLTSPPISIPVGGSVTMTFKTYEEWPGDYDYEGVWVATEGNDDEVWVQTEPSAEWKKVTIDLTAYQGQVVTIEFDYEGTDAHSWYIDAVMITSDFQPCPPVSAPYVERFDTGLGECMYAFETDHDGRCWEWELVYQAAFHPNGAGSNQGGALLTPNVMLSASKAYQLSFDFRAAIPSKGESSDPVEFSVWMGVDSNGLGDLGDFNEIWRRVPVASTSEFETVTIDLSPYSGHSVQFAFVYQGNGDYGWLIDNVAVVERIGVDENGPSTGSGTLVIYPNPATDRVRIEGLEADSEVKLFNAVGELVKTVKVDSNSEINIVELAKGLYLVRCGTATMRFVKE